MEVHREQLALACPGIPTHQHNNKQTGHLKRQSPGSVRAVPRAGNSVHAVDIRTTPMSLEPIRAGAAPSTSHRRTEPSSDAVASKPFTRGLPHTEYENKSLSQSVGGVGWGMQAPLPTLTHTNTLHWPTRKGGGHSLRRHTPKVQRAGGVAAQGWHLPHRRTGVSYVKIQQAPVLAAHLRPTHEDEARTMG
jgi:hypothetical protein